MYTYATNYLHANTRKTKSKPLNYTSVPFTPFTPTITTDNTINLNDTISIITYTITSLSLNIQISPITQYTLKSIDNIDDLNFPENLEF